MKNFLGTYPRILTALGILTLTLFIFWAGMLVGLRKAEFSYRWNNHYAEVFGSDFPPFQGRRGDRDMIISSNGAIGQVIAIHLPAIAVKGPNEIEKSILISSSTVIRKFRDTATTADIHVGDTVIAIGTPDAEGRIVATLLRIMMMPSASGTPMMQTFTRPAPYPMPY